MSEQVFSPGMPKEDEVHMDSGARHALRHGDANVISSSGLAGRLRRGVRPAVVVVDLQHGFTDPSEPLGSEMDDVILATASLLVAAREAGHLVVFTVLALGRGVDDGGIFVQKIPTLGRFVEGTRPAEVDGRLAPRTEEPVIAKRAASACFGTHLVPLLVAQRCDTAIVCGTSTSGCIRATAVDLMQHGFPVLIPEECVGDRSTQAHAQSLADLDAKYADVITLAEATSYLTQLATTAPI
jgi:nicotinamidase-related amidase